MVRRGFSLIELLIVVSLMGILAALATASLNPGTHEELQAAAHVLTGDLAYGRSLAVANNSKYRYQFDMTNNRYVLSHSGSNAALNDLPEASFRSPSDPVDQQIVNLGDLPHLSGQCVRLAAVATASGTRLNPSEIEFGPLGETTQSQETVVWLAAGSDSQTRYLPVHVNPVTGIATVGSYRSSLPTAPAAASVSGP
jgi:prepilin-type N-terminal cleavage/methylation domain-containing protein